MVLAQALLLRLLHVGYFLLRGEPRVAEGVEDHFPRRLDFPVHHRGVLVARKWRVRIVHAVFGDELRVKLQRDEVVEALLPVNHVERVPVVESLVEDHQAFPDAVRFDEVAEGRHVDHVSRIRLSRDWLIRLGVEGVQQADILGAFCPRLAGEA